MTKPSTNTIKVATNLNGQRLDAYLAESTGSSRHHWQKLIRQNLVQVNGAPVKTSYLVTEGDTVLWTLPVAIPASEPTPLDINIVYQDDGLIVIDKPAGVLTHAYAELQSELTVADFVRPMVNDPDPVRGGIIHRLDRGTSGLLLVARHQEAKEYYQNLFRQRLISKTYTGLAMGRVHPAAAVISLPLSRRRKQPLKQTVTKGGRASSTSYKALEYYTGYTLLELKPQTGRTHQIRAHLAHLGHPIAGDKLYGGYIPKLSRQFLHASQLEFIDHKGRPSSFTSPLPPDLNDFLKQLKAQNG
jgi:23S rRNA pseudouridine1911/1915/1917 synthase